MPMKAAWSSFDMAPRKSSSASEKALLAADGAWRSRTWGMSEAREEPRRVRYWEESLTRERCWAAIRCLSAPECYKRRYSYAVKLTTKAPTYPRSSRVSVNMRMRKSRGPRTEHLYIQALVPLSALPYFSSLESLFRLEKIEVVLPTHADERCGVRSKPEAGESPYSRISRVPVPATSPLTAVPFALPFRSLFLFSTLF